MFLNINHNNNHTYMEAYGQGDLSWDYKNGKADYELFGMAPASNISGCGIFLGYAGGAAKP